MTFRSKLGAAVVAVALAAATLAASAQGQTFNPDNSAVTGVAAFPTLDYEGTTWVCDIGTAEGNTGQDSSSIPDVALTFEQNCSLAGILDVEIFCEGDTSLIAQNATANTATIELNQGFRCDIVSDLCTISIEGPQTTQSGNLQLQGEDPTNPNADPKLDANVDMLATRNAQGSELCGPESGTLNFTAQYDVTPTNVSIDP
jgi:hypothetical protein